MRTLLTMIALAGSPLLAFAQAPAPTAGKFETKVFKNEDGHESPYVLYVPPGYDGSKPFPLILFLHGSGETKGGGTMPVDQGIGTHIRGKLIKKIPALVLIPQAESRSWQADGPNGKRAMAMLAEVEKEYKVDPARIYLTGLSMGGYGTWSLAAAYPEKWAAIVPICGGGNPADADKIKHIPCWVWHGDKDQAVKVERSRDMVAALKKAGGTPRYTELEEIGHFSWDAAYASEDLYAWLFAQKKP